MGDSIFTKIRKKIGRLFGREETGADPEAPEVQVPEESPQTAAYSTGDLSLDDVPPADQTKCRMRQKDRSPKARTPRKGKSLKSRKMSGVRKPKRRQICGLRKRKIFREKKRMISGLRIRKKRKNKKRYEQFLQHGIISGAAGIYYAPKSLLKTGRRKENEDH